MRENLFKSIRFNRSAKRGYSREFYNNKRSHESLNYEKTYGSVHGRTKKFIIRIGGRKIRTLSIERYRSNIEPKYIVQSV